MNAVISSPAPAKPVRYIINTSAAPEHVGGNEKIATTGFFPRVRGFGAAVASVGARRVDRRARERAQPDERAGGQAAAPAGGGAADRYVFRRVPQAAGILQRRSA